MRSATASVLRWLVPVVALCVPLSIAFADDDNDPSEPNDLPATAWALVPGEEASFALTPRLDRDVFALTAPAAGVLAAAWLEKPAVHQGWLRWLAAAGTVLRGGEADIRLAAQQTVYLEVRSTYSDFVARRVALAAPGSLTASPANATRVLLAWSSVPEAQSYRMYRQPEGLLPVTGPTAIQATEYEDLGRSAGQTYRYWVCWVDRRDLEGRCSQSVSVTMPD